MCMLACLLVCYSRSQKLISIVSHGCTQSMNHMVISLRKGRPKFRCQVTHCVHMHGSCTIQSSRRTWRDFGQRSISSRSHTCQTRIKVLWLCEQSMNHISLKKIGIGVQAIGNWNRRTPEDEAKILDLPQSYWWSTTSIWVRAMTGWLYEKLILMTI